MKGFPAKLIAPSMSSTLALMAVEEAACLLAGAKAAAEATREARIAVFIVGFLVLNEK